MIHTGSRHVFSLAACWGAGRRQNRRHQGLHVGIAGRTSVMSALEKHGLWELSLHVLCGCEQQDVRNCSSAISACEKASEWLRALHLLAAMRMEQLQPVELEELT
eukprot:6373980-Amphidinium_carterae.2